MKNISLIFILLILFFACKHKQTDSIVLPDSFQIKSLIIENELQNVLKTEAFENYGRWLDIIVSKHDKVKYLTLLKKMYETCPNLDCKKQTLMALSDSLTFRSVIKEFRTLHFQDKKLLVRGFNFWSSSEVGTFFSLFDKKDSLISFRYDPIDEDEIGGGHLTTLSMQDWNKNGSLDLITCIFSRCSGLKNYDICIYDLKDANYQFVPLFTYTKWGKSRTGTSTIDKEWKDSVQILSPTKLRKIELQWLILKKVNTKHELQQQKEWIKILNKRGEKIFSAKKTIYCYNDSCKMFLPN